MEILTYPNHAFEDRTVLVRRVVSCSGPDYCPSHVLLDGGDYSNDDNVLDEFRDIAFYWNHDRPKDRVPAHVLRVMDDDLCSNLIWLSRRALQEEEILFVWVVAHELRHIYQATKGVPFEALRRASRDLRRKAKFIDLPSSLLSTAELDSDIFAMQTARSIFGREQMIEFFGRRLLPRCPIKQYVPFLQCLDLACSDNEWGHAG